MLLIVCQWLTRLLTLDVFTEEFSSVLGERLVVVAPHGSAVVEDRSDHCADSNSMVVCQQFGLQALEAMTPLVAKWAAQGIPPPLLFALDRLLAKHVPFDLSIFQELQELQELLDEGERARGI